MCARSLRRELAERATARIPLRGAGKGSHVRSPEEPLSTEGAERSVDTESERSPEFHSFCHSFLPPGDYGNVYAAEEEPDRG